MKWLARVFVLFFVLVGCAGSPGAPRSGHALASYTKPSTGGVLASSLSYSFADQAKIAGNGVLGNAGYTAGTPFRFLKAATITGVRFVCFGTVTTVKVRVVDSFTATSLTSATCGATAGNIVTCAVTPQAISDLSKTYTASAYETGGAGDCTYAPTGSDSTLFNTANSVPTCSTNVTGVCIAGPSIVHIGAWRYVSGDAVPTSRDANSYAGVEFVYTVP